MDIKRDVEYVLRRWVNHEGKREKKRTLDFWFGFFGEKKESIRKKNIRVREEGKERFRLLKQKRRKTTFFLTRKVIVEG